MAGLSQLAPAEGLFASLTRLFSKLTRGGGGVENLYVTLNLNFLLILL